MLVGPYSIPVPVVLAPMAGITDQAFRRACQRFGVGLTFGEMQATKPNLRGSTKSRLRLAHVDEPLPRAIQLVGNNSEDMANAARYNVDEGAGWIDINMGCPAKKVCSKAAGSALLADEAQVARILSAVVNAVDVPVSLKIRTGINIDNRNGVRIANIAESEGIQALTVHGRTRACKFGGVAEYETIKAIKSTVSIPVIANGDIDSLSKARAVLASTDADAVMIGRAALGQPWIPGLIGEALQADTNIESIINPSIEQQRIAVLEHIEGLYSLYGTRMGIRIARKHIKWYFGHFPSSIDWVRANNQLEDPAQCLQLLNEFYDRVSERKTIERMAA